MPRRNRRGNRRRKSTTPPVEVERQLSTEQMAARLVSKGLASPMILSFHRWRTPGEGTPTDPRGALTVLRQFIPPSRIQGPQARAND